MKPAVVDNGPQISAPADPAATRPRVTFNQRLQYWAAMAVLKTLGWLPHKLARGVCALLAALSYWLWPRLRRVGLFNLRLAFPEWNGAAAAPGHLWSFPEFRTHAGRLRPFSPLESRQH